MPPPEAAPAPSGPSAPPEPVAVTSFVGPEPCDLWPVAPPVDIDMEVAWPQAFAVELPRGPQGFGMSLWGGRDLNMGVYVRRLREGGPAQRCGRIQVSDQLLAINGAPTAGMTHAQALACIRGGGQPPAPAAAPGPRAPPKSSPEGGPDPLHQQLPPGRAVLLPRGTPGLGGGQLGGNAPLNAPPSVNTPPAPPLSVLGGDPPHFWGGPLPFNLCNALPPLPVFGGAQ
ncbi:PDZ domain-containing protein MAGIX [Strigops habroptila]|uniref:PDZ domain-containing protein MAGIX n=1 Tax=Strigops habroptila TaxID=2489341 RepID=UPI0011CFA86A|nr:PDZ domain-containing protein MAGIX [Strigops habroptila]